MADSAVLRAIRARLLGLVTGRPRTALAASFTLGAVAGILVTVLF